MTTEPEYGPPVARPLLMVTVLPLANTTALVRAPAAASPVRPAPAPPNVRVFPAAAAVIVVVPVLVIDRVFRLNVPVPMLFVAVYPVVPPNTRAVVNPLGGTPWLLVGSSQ